MSYTSIVYNIYHNFRYVNFQGAIIVEVQYHASGGNVGRKESDVFSLAFALIVKAAVLVAKWAGRARRRALDLVARGSDERGQEILLLRERVRELESRIAILRGQLRKRGGRPRYSLRERLMVIWALEYFIPTQGPQGVHRRLHGSQDPRQASAPERQFSRGLVGHARG